MTRTKNESGFTLVELAIVLVIIGLIVGGVLAGQDLIKAAQVRNAQGQVQSINTAVTTFQLKYNGLPGDLAQSLATGAGMTAITTGTSAAGLRDGNGLIEGYGGTVTSIGGENLAFWSDLSIAQLMNGAPNTYGTVTAAGTPQVAAITSSNAGSYVLTSKLRNTANIGVTNFGGKNTIWVGAFVASAGTATVGGTPAITAGLTPLEAAAFETKFDDGIPNSGTVRVIVDTNAATSALTLPLPAYAATAATTTCTSGTGASYNTLTTGSSAGGNNVNCALVIATSF